MQELLTIRVTNTGLLCTQDRYHTLMAGSEEQPGLTAWRNDTAVAQLALLSADAPVADVRAAARDFTCGDAVLPKTQTTCTFLRETKAFIGNGKKDNGSRASFPDILDTQGPVTIPAHSVQGVWVSIRVPEDACPGVYHGEITVSAPALSEDISVPFSLEVLPLTAPNPENYRFDLELWQYPYRVAQYYQVEPFGERHLAILCDHLALYRAAGGHAITASIVEEPWNGQTYGQYPSMIKWTCGTDRQFRFDFTEFDKWVELCHSMGIGDKIVCYSLIPWGNRITYLDEKTGQSASTEPRAGTRRYRKIWTQFLQALAAHTEQKGWFDQIYIGIDERSHMKQAYDLIDTVRSSGGKTFKKAAAMNHFSARFFPLIDRMTSVSVGSEQMRGAQDDYRKLAVRRKGQASLRTTGYTCVGHFPNSFTYSMPAESYWTIFFCASRGANGFLRWAYDAWVKDPLRDTTHVSFESGDCFLVYPDEPDATHPVTKSSVRMEKLAQGMRDLNKLLWLAEQSPAARMKAEAILQTVRCDYTQTKESTAVADDRTRAELPRDMDVLRGAMDALAWDFFQESRMTP